MIWQLFAKIPATVLSDPQFKFARNHTAHGRSIALTLTLSDVSVPHVLYKRVLERHARPLLWTIRTWVGRRIKTNNPPLPQRNMWQGILNYAGGCVNFNWLGSPAFSLSQATAPLMARRRRFYYLPREVRTQNKCHREENNCKQASEATGKL